MSKTDNTNKIKHLEFIQDVITRMAYNSFLIKGWAITIVSAISLVYLIRIDAIKGNDVDNCILVVLPVFSMMFFAFLDAYYLYLEKSYREVYNSVRPPEYINIDFNMDYKEYNEGRPIIAYIKSLLSKSILLFYSGLLLYALLPSLLLGVSPLCLWHKIKTLLNLLC